MRTTLETERLNDAQLVEISRDGDTREDFVRSLHSGLLWIDVNR
jgi:hypothetical protein